MIKAIKELKSSIKCLIIIQIIILFFQVISVFYCIIENGFREITILNILSFICFFIAFIIDIVFKYDFTGNKVYKLIPNLLLIIISGYFLFSVFISGLSICLPFLGCSSGHPLNFLHGITLLFMIVYFFAYICISVKIQFENNEEIIGINDEQHINTLKSNYNEYSNMDADIIIPQNK